MLGPLAELGPVSGDFHFVGTEEGGDSQGPGARVAGCWPGPCPTEHAWSWEKQALPWPRDPGSFWDKPRRVPGLAAPGRAHAGLRALFGPTGSQPFPHGPMRPGTVTGVWVPTVRACVPGWALG